MFYRIFDRKLIGYSNFFKKKKNIDLFGFLSKTYWKAITWNFYGFTESGKKKKKNVFPKNVNLKFSNANYNFYQRLTCHKLKETFPDFCFSPHHVNTTNI